MKFLNKLERKFGKYAIPNLAIYMVSLMIAGWVLSLIDSTFYYNYLALDVAMVLKGQVWRIVTFLLAPPDTSAIFFVVEILLNLVIGTSLERFWGAFRFNLYYFSGVLLQIIAAFAYYFIMGGGPNVWTMGVGSLYNISHAMFLAYLVLVPNDIFLVLFIIPIKAKWLGYLYGGVLIYQVVSLLFEGTQQGIAEAVSILISLANFLVFFFATRKYKKLSPAQMQRRKAFRNSMQNSGQRQQRMQGERTPNGQIVEFRPKKTETRHCCVVCQRTEKDDDSLEFRFCSKCEGDYEYCMEHLYTHKHVKTYDVSETGDSNAGTAPESEKPATEAEKTVDTQGKEDVNGRKEDNKDE